MKKEGGSVMRVSNEKIVRRHPIIGFLAGRKIRINNADVVQTPRGTASKFFVSRGKKKEEVQILNRFLIVISPNQNLHWVAYLHKFAAFFYFHKIDIEFLSNIILRL